MGQIVSETCKSGIGLWPVNFLRAQSWLKGKSTLVQKDAITQPCNHKTEAYATLLQLEQSLHRLEQTNRFRLSVVGRGLFTDRFERRV